MFQVKELVKKVVFENPDKAEVNCTALHCTETCTYDTLNGHFLLHNYFTSKSSTIIYKEHYTLPVQQMVEAAGLFLDVVTARQFPEFLTTLLR